MIEEPPLITIIENLNDHATTLALSQAFQSIPTSFIVDAMNGSGAMHKDIKPCSPDQLPSNICGPALTCDCGPGDILGLLAALAEVQKGDVLVMSTGEWLGCACVGDRVIGMAKNAGAAGFICDGVVRDIDGINEVGLPVFCQGVSPNSPVAKGPCVVGNRVLVGGSSVATGDIVVADKDGVVIVPLAYANDVLARIEKIKVLETQLDAEVEQGLACPEWVRTLLASEQTVRIKPH